MNNLKYKLEKNRGSIFTCRDLNFFERLRYRLKGYKVIKLKSVDTVEIVRCGYCKYYDEEQLECKVKFDSNGERLAMGFWHYCSDGKRKK